VVSEKGKEAVVALHEKGDFFGEGCLTGQPIHSSLLNMVLHETPGITTRGSDINAGSPASQKEA